MPVERTLFDVLADDRAESVQTDCQGIRGLTYVRRFLASPEQEHILKEVGSRPWLPDLKREVQHYGYKYDYRSRAIDASMYVGPLPEFAVDVARRLVGRKLIEQMPDQMIVNKYEPGQGIALHVDCEPCFANTIVTVSLGSVYTMDFKRLEKDEYRHIPLEQGSALILRDEARSQWMHGIKSRRSEPWGPRGTRVSLTFRNVILMNSAK